ncbi:efflux RND transporter periplasmic adaptor subunit [Marinobacter sp. F4218]|uniref:efflux RND transporter periplasmic adaptor subunit n=1 Tax=Marinobacter sp. F4218 TaxID=2862868 RepID=UPI001C6384E1|nr:efflux RND transporter periplasmic adaptor subunit [Marinobacter sp. F4218]MBW7472558.1 efflux RND transporter periplasmic adaptor subunit [Marinobacter sp. F4218]
MSKGKWGSLGLSLLVIIALAVWLATGDIKMASEAAPEKQEIGEQELTSVQVESLIARLHEPGLLLQGQLEPWHAVMISARVAGTVEKIEVDLGQHVKSGDTLVTLSDDGRRAVVDRWRARVRSLEADLAAARKLRSNNLASQSEMLNLESELAAANAELAAARLDVAHLTPKAPFDGIINARDVEQGGLVQVGSPMFELVRIDRLKATGQIPQQSAGKVSPGQRVRVDLLNGKKLDGIVTFVASAANPETRSFAVEIAVENPDLRRVAGGSASFRIALPEVKAMFISPAYLSLGDDGRPGVKYVNEDNRVVFSTVELLSVATNGAWVTGLPDEIRLITRGGGFVSVGEQVRPVDAAEDRG